MEIGADLCVGVDSFGILKFLLLIHKVNNDLMHVNLRPGKWNIWLEIFEFRYSNRGYASHSAESLAH